jgi:cell division protein FtsL
MKPLPRNKTAVVTPLPGVRPAPRIKKKWPVLYLLGLLLVYFLILFTVQFFRYIQLNNEVRALSREIERIRGENALLAEEIERLNDPEYLEELARDRLGMARPGEVLFNIQEPPATP